MSNSSLANYIDRTTQHFIERGDEIIQRVTVHSANSKGTIQDLSRLINSSDRRAYNYGIDSDGTVGLFVDEMYAACGTGNDDNDKKTVNIVVMNSNLTNFAISKGCMESLLNLITDICRRNFITQLTYTGDAKTDTFNKHSQFAKVSCPGPYLNSQWSFILAQVNANLTKGVFASSPSAALKAQSTLTMDTTNPFLAVISPDCTDFDANALKQARVIGAMLCAGTYFDAGHYLAGKYRNKNLAKQIKKLDGANLNYALYGICRAKNVDEAVLELNELYVTVALYPPKLGLWMKLEIMTKNSTVAQQIVQKYYDEFVKWGLKSKCGLYGTKEQLNLVGWPNQAEYMSMWLIEPLSSTKKIEEIFTPSLFKI